MLSFLADFDVDEIMRRLILATNKKIHDRKETTLKRRTMLKQCGTGAATLLGIHSFSFAQSKVTRLIVPFAVGGSTDILARELAEQLRRLTGQTYVVDNKPGGAGRVASELALAANPDGRTLIVNVASNYTLVPHTNREPADRNFTTFLPVSALSVLDFALYVNPSVPANNVSEYLQLVKKDSSFGFYSTSALGNITHFLGLMFAGVTKLSMQDIPFQGGGPALLGVIGGHVPSGIGSVSTPLIQAHNIRRIRALAIMSATRSPFLPDVPTMAESGVPEVTLSDWIGVFAPPGTPQTAIDSINALVTEVHKQPEFVLALRKIMLEPTIAGPAECLARLRKEFAIWQPVVRASGFVAD